MSDFKQVLSNLPQAILDAPHFVPVDTPASRKPCSGCDWPTPRTHRKYTELLPKFNYVSFVITQSKEFGGYAQYAFVDMNNVLDDNGNFVSDRAAEWFKKLHADGSYCEKSISGRGLHIIIKPKINDDLPEGRFKIPLDDTNKDICINVAYKTPWTWLVTGDCFDCQPQAPVTEGDDADNIFMTLISAATNTPLEQVIAARPKDIVVDIPAQHAKFRVPAAQGKFRDSLSKTDIEKISHAIRVTDPDFVAHRLSLGKANHSGYICPNPDCDNGAGRDGTGIKPKYWSGHYRWHCFKCGKSWDNVALVADYLGLSMQGKDYIEVIKKGAEILEVKYTPEGEWVAPDAAKSAAPANDESKPLKDYTDFYNNASRPNLPKLLEQCGGHWRGLSKETLEHFFCGYIPKFGKDKMPFVIIPYSKNHYFARYCGAPDKAPKKTKLNSYGGNFPLFNAKLALDNDDPVCFVVESAIDAMSIYHASNYNAIAVSGASLSACQREQIAACSDKKFIVMLDGDGAGQSGNQPIVDQLIELGHMATAITLSDSYKDANDFLQADPKGLAARLITIYEAATEFFANAPTSATPQKPAQAVDAAVEEWQKINGAINPDTLSNLINAKKYLDELQHADITPGVAKSSKTTQALALCSYYDCYVEVVDLFFAKLAQAKRAADAELKTHYQNVKEQPLELVAIKNIGITEIKSDVLATAKVYKKAHKEYVKSEKQRKNREESQAKQEARAVELSDLRKRLETLKKQDQCRERDDAIRESINELCTWKHDKAGNPVAIEATQQNADLMFTYDPDIDGLFAYNEFTEASVFLKPPPWNDGKQRGDTWQDADKDQLCVYLRRTYGEFNSKDITKETFTDFSHQRRFHPIREFLNDLPAWDGKPRAETLFIDWLKVPDTPFARAVTMNWLTGAIARVFHPGCRYQTALVLAGPQGVGKSFILERLGREWADTLSDAIDDPHAIDAIRKMWITEIKEGAAWKKADADAQKRFIDTAKDTRRFAYQEFATTYHRQNVIAITINGKQFLSDLTGNRRYMILESQNKNGYVEEVRGEHLTDDAVIDQVWAEAFAHYKKLFAAGFDEKKLELSRDMKAQIETVAQEYTRDDDLKGEIQAALDAKILKPVIWDLMTKAERREFMTHKSFTIEDCVLKTRFEGLSAKKQAALKPEYDAATQKCNFVHHTITRDRKTNEYYTYFTFFGTEYRQHVCAAEILTECFEKGDRRVSSVKIVSILEQTEGWTKDKPLFRDTVYGDQRNVYWRDSDNIPTDDIPTDDTPPIDYDDFGGELIDPDDIPFDTVPVENSTPEIPVKNFKPMSISLNLHGYQHADTKIPGEDEPDDNELPYDDDYYFEEYDAEYDSVSDELPF